MKIALFIFTLLTAGCSSVQQSAEVTNAEIPSGTWLMYEGILPCADCSGVKTTLDIYVEYEDPNPPYVITETFLGASDTATVVTEGTYNTLRGIESDPDATVWELDYNNHEGLRYFLNVGYETVRMLSKERKEISSDLNYTLKRTQ